jgi:hypothetical protein
MSFVDSFIAHVTRNYPSGKHGLEIGGAADPYLRRWYVIPRNRWFNLYLHNIRRSDEDRALHDHPWCNVSIVLRGGYVEIVPTPGATKVAKWRPAGSIVIRRPRAAHRLVVSEVLGPVWTLFITGPRLREWGFWCPKGWVHWKDFTAGPQGELIGRGCGEP